MYNQLNGRTFSALFSAFAASMVLFGCSAIDRIGGTKPGEFHTSASIESSRLVGKKTASGQRFNPEAMTAASRTLPLGSTAELTNVKTGAKATVTINDRGPYGTAGRGLDLSKMAARTVGSKGLVNVTVDPSKRTPPVNSFFHFSPN